MVRVDDLKMGRVCVKGVLWLAIGLYRLTCVCADVCLQVGALVVHLATAAVGTHVRL